MAKNTSSVCLVICVRMHTYVYSKCLTVLDINCLKIVKKNNFYIKWGCINAIWTAQKYFKNQHKNI